MKINIKSILTDYKTRTGKIVSQSQLAREMTEAGIFRNFASARGMIFYNTSGKAKMLDIEIIQFLMKRFDIKSMDQIIEQ